MRRPLTTAFGLALAAVLLSTISAPDARAEGRNLTGTQAPDLYVQQGLFGLDTGATLYAFRGQVVVLKFFFTECPACRDSMPEFQRQHTRFSARGAKFIAVAYDTADHVRGMWSRGGYSIPVAIDENGINAQRYGLLSYPTNYLIGADGTVRSYDDISDWVIERELSRTRPAASAPVLATAATGTAAPAASVAGSVADRNVRELGFVPPTLAAATSAAAENDYGAVLRVVEKHVSLTTDPADVVTAARRIEAIAKTRYQNRLSRIEARRTLGEVRGAYDALARMAADFRGTQYDATLAAKASAWRADLERVGSVASR